MHAACLENHSGGGGGGGGLALEDRRFSPTLAFYYFTLSQRGFFCAPKTKGGGAFCPLAKTLFPSSETMHVKILCKLVQKWVSWQTLVSMETIVSILRWFIVSDFWLGTPIQNQKPCSLCRKSTKVTFFWNPIKGQSKWHHFVGLEIVFPNLRSLKHKRGCKTKLSRGCHPASRQAQTSRTD